MYACVACVLVRVVGLLFDCVVVCLVVVRCVCVFVCVSVFVFFVGGLFSVLMCLVVCLSYVLVDWVLLRVFLRVRSCLFAPFVCI